jgi:hypothetical protein
MINFLQGLARLLPYHLQCLQQEKPKAPTTRSKHIDSVLSGSQEPANRTRLREAAVGAVGQRH